MELKVLKEWKSHTGEEVDALDYINYNMNPEHVYLMGKYIFFPEIVEFRGGYFLADRISEETYKTWLKTLNGNIPEVEKVLNHVHVYDLFGYSEEIDEDVFLEIGQQMALSWKMHLKHRFPSRSFVVHFNDGSDDYGPTVTFYQG